MKRRKFPPATRVELDFTDLPVTGCAGTAFLGEEFRQRNLRRRLKKALRIKKRRKGPDEGAAILTLVALLALGNGSLSDADALCDDFAALAGLGLGEVPTSRRLGELLARFTKKDIAALSRVVRETAAEVLPAVVEHALARDGHVSVFIDGSPIEVKGRHFENAKVGYNGKKQYWLHCVFVNGLLVAMELQPGGGPVTKNWRPLLKQAKAALPLKTADGKPVPVWLAADHAYYSKQVVEFLDEELGWGHSLSVTNPKRRGRAMEQVEGLGDDAWTYIGPGEEAILASHRPAKWHREYDYVVVRRMETDKDGNPKWIHSVILVSRADLPLKELVRRHRSKQGQENFFKGLLIDMDLHHPPCRKHLANQAFYLCGQLAQILLRSLQYNFLPKEARIHGIRPIIRYFMRSSALLAYHGRKFTLRFSKTSFQLGWLWRAVECYDGG